ncbi:MAG: cytidine deaminase [Clostridia bacterium]|nr:cytidine deaminase [Clostridia bacterium]
MAVELYIETCGAPEGLLEFLTEVTNACWQQEGIAEALMSIRIVDDEEIHKLNLATRDVDRPTDVLSYPEIAYPAGKTARDCPKRLKRQYDPESGMVYLGDCVISLPRAEAQAAEFGHSLRREIGYLTAHSAFHLMGYDHMNDEDKARMREMEKRAMRQIKLWRDDTMTDERLFEMACEAMQMSYSPYSNHKVGACILTDDGRTFKGANFENASYGATICAERCAAGNAIINGARKFVAVAIVGSSGMAWPCGVCRQVLNEFAVPGMKVIVAEYGSKDIVVKTIEELLPESFGPADLGINV